MLQPIPTIKTLQLELLLKIFGHLAHDTKLIFAVVPAVCWRLWEVCRRWLIPSVAAIDFSTAGSCNWALETKQEAQEPRGDYTTARWFSQRSPGTITELDLGYSLFGSSIPGRDVSQAEGDAVFINAEQMAVAMLAQLCPNLTRFCMECCVGSSSEITQASSN